MPWIGERLSAIAIRPPALKVLDTFPSRHLAHVEAPVRPAARFRRNETRAS